jgi:hypothetical protein
MTTVFDSPDPGAVASKAHALRNAGTEGAILYISPGFPAGSKTVKKPQIEAIHNSDIAVAFVCEWWGGSDNFAHHDINAAYGTRDGAFCSHYLKTLGAPDGTAVYPTVDNDVTNAWLKQLCLPYFRAFRTAMDKSYRMGAYGPGALLFALEAEDPKILDFPWLSNAMGWSRSHEYAATGRATITQQRETKLLGIDIDPDVVKGSLLDAGFWMPPAPAVA